MGLRPFPHLSAEMVVKWSSKNYRATTRTVCDLVVSPELCIEPGQFVEGLLSFDRAPALIREDVA